MRRTKNSSLSSIARDSEQSLSVAGAISSATVTGTAVTNGNGPRVAFRPSLALKPGEKQGRVGGKVHIVRAVEYIFDYDFAADTTEFGILMTPRISRGIEENEGFNRLFDADGNPSDCIHETTLVLSQQPDTEVNGHVNGEASKYFEFPVPSICPVPYFLEWSAVVNQDVNQSVGLNMIAYVYYTSHDLYGDDYERLLMRYTGAYGGQGRGKQRL